LFSGEIYDSLLTLRTKDSAAAAEEDAEHSTSVLIAAVFVVVIVGRGAMVRPLRGATATAVAAAGLAERAEEADKRACCASSAAG